MINLQENMATAGNLERGTYWVDGYTVFFILKPKEHCAILCCPCNPTFQLVKNLGFVKESIQSNSKIPSVSR
jgi:hypothetical protein